MKVQSSGKITDEQKILYKENNSS